MSTEPTTAIKCLSCGTALLVPAFLNACSTFHATTGTVAFICPSCGCAAAVRLSSFEVELGWLSAAGAPHFSCERSISVPELVAYRRGATQFAEVDSDSWEFGAGTR